MTEKKTREVSDISLPTFPFNKNIINQLTNISLYLGHYGPTLVDVEFPLLAGYFHCTISGKKACTITTCGSMDEHAHPKLDQSTTLNVLLEIHLVSEHSLIKHHSELGYFVNKHL